MSDQLSAVAPRTLSEDQKDALIAEMLGDVVNLHRSVKDLVAITDDADRRITARVSEIRSLVANLSGMREALLAELAARAGAEAQRVLRESLGDLQGRIAAGVSRLELQPALDMRRQWTDRAAVAIVTAAITSVVTLAGVAVLLHFH